MDNYQQAPVADDQAANQNQPAATVPEQEPDEAQNPNEQFAPRSDDHFENSREYDQEIKSDKIETKRKTFFLDLKSNEMGKYVKISERSSGKRSTIIIPEENISEFLEKIQGLFN